MTGSFRLAESAEHRRRLGRAGELVAARVLRRAGAVVIARNLRLAGGEIDLLVRFGSERVVVEVRSVRAEEGLAAPDPVDALSEEKLRRVCRLASTLRPAVARVDLVAVRFHRSGVDVRWLRNAG